MHWHTTILSLEDPGAQDRWEVLYEHAPDRTPYSSIDYIRTVCDIFSLNGELHLVHNEEGDHAGILVYWRKRGLYREVVIPPVTQYSSFLYRRPPSEAKVHTQHSALEELLSSIAKRFHIVRSFLDGSLDMRPALWQGWEVTPYYTYRLTMEAVSDPLSLWSSTKRRTFRKHHAHFCFEETETDVSSLIALCEQSYLLQNRPLPSQAVDLEALVSALLKKGLVRLFTVTASEGVSPAGALAVLNDGISAYYWLAGSERGPAMTVLLGHVLPVLKKDGYKQFDFVGANTPSIAEFKRQFGPTLTPYYYLEHMSRPELRIRQFVKRL